MSLFVAKKTKKQEMTAQSGFSNAVELSPSGERKASPITKRKRGASGPQSWPIPSLRVWVRLFTGWIWKAKKNKSEISETLWHFPAPISIAEMSQSRQPLFCFKKTFWNYVIFRSYSWTPSTLSSTCQILWGNCFPLSQNLNWLLKSN